MTTTEVVVAESGADVFPDGCEWLVEVASFNPEPDFPEDLVRIVACGAPVVLTHDGQGWRCEAGHEHLPMHIAHAPGGPEYMREMEERLAEEGWS